MKHFIKYYRFFYILSFLFIIIVSQKNYENSLFSDYSQISTCSDRDEMDIISIF